MADSSPAQTPETLSSGSSAVAPSTLYALPIGAMIEEFRIVHVLGAGSFGIVYECQNTYLPETAAIKEFLPPELACRTPDGQVTPLSAQTEESFRWARDRFLQEAKTLWELARPNPHPNIVRVTRYCEANGTAYMFMELEQGRSLAEILKAQRRLSPQELEAVFYPVMAGLERVHAAGVVHRDLKPANILIRADGSPVLIDFGAARRAVAGGERSVMSAYTPVYAALEQYQDAGEQGPWTDIYSFGATLYQAVTGRNPLSALERLFGASQKPVAEECEGSYPQPILVAIDKALAIKAVDRPQSVAEWRRCLLEASITRASEETVVIPTAGPGEPTRIAATSGAEDRTFQGPGATSAKQSIEIVAPRSRVWLAAAAAGALILGGIGFYYWHIVFPPAPLPPPPEPKEVEPVLPDEPLPQPISPDVTEPVEPEPPAIVPGTRFSDPLPGGTAGPIMVWLPAGEFQMGSPPDEAGRNPDERRHPARVPEPLAFAETEVTLAQFRGFVEDAGYRTEVDRESTCLRPDESWQELVPDMSLTWESPGYPVTDRHPVTCISWNDARAYADWLTEKTGYQYRLPTELEWEYAARAGSSSIRFWGDDPHAGCSLANTAECKDDYRYAAPAGTLAPNPFGLRDMLGNLAEWTCSEYGKGYSGQEARCSDVAGNAPRVFRGGSWLDAPDLVRSAARDGAPANLGLNTVGFRVVRTIPAPTARDDAETLQAAEAQ